MTILRSVGEFSAVYMRSKRSDTLDVRLVDVFGFVETDSEGIFAIPLVLNEHGYAVHAAYWQPSAKDDVPWEFVGVVANSTYRVGDGPWWITAYERDGNGNPVSGTVKYGADRNTPTLLGLNKFESHLFFDRFIDRVLKEAKARAALAVEKDEASK